MSSKEISKFTQQVSFLDTDLFNIVRNSTNNTVAASSLPAFLGVTGTIDPIGGLGAPVLEQPTETTNNIRNLESGNGVIASISPENGINLSMNITVDAEGVPLVVDKNVSAPVFRSIVSGDGASVTEDGNTVVVSSTGILQLNKVIVNTIDDLPSPSGGVIKLEDNKNYHFSSPITTDNRFELGVDNTITMENFLQPTLTYTGSDPMFTAVDKRCRFIACNFTCANATWLDASATLPGGLLFIDDVLINECDILAELSNLTFVSIMTFSCNESSSGISVAGSDYQIFEIDRMALFSTDLTFIGLDLGTSVHNRLNIEGSFSAPLGAIGIKGAASSANVNVGQLARVFGCNFTDDMTPVSGIDSGIRWDFFENAGIPDTVVDGLISIEGNALDTVIAAVDTPVKINGVFDSEQLSFFTHDGTGRLTYIGERTARLPIDFTSTLLASSGGDKQYTFYIAINGVVLSQTGKQVTANNSKAVSATTFWQHDFETGDYVEIWIENNDSSINIICQQAIGRVN